MKLEASDVFLTGSCESVRCRLQSIAEIAQLELRVASLSNFAERFPNHAVDPGIYCHSEKAIFINSETFPQHIPEAVLAHEVGHAALRHGAFAEYALLDPEIAADFLAACKFGFGEEIRRDRAKYGPDYLELLDCSLSAEDLNRAIQRFWKNRLLRGTPYT